MLGEVGLRTRRNRKMSDDDEIYVLRAGVNSGPYAREEAIKLLADGTIDDNTLVRIGLEGECNRQSGAESGRRGGHLRNWGKEKKASRP